MNADESVVHRVRPRFDESNPLLEIGLGLRALAARWDRLVASYAPDDGVLKPDDFDRDSSERAGVEFLLGIVALRKRLDPLFAAPEPRSPQPESAGRTTEGERSLLR